MSASAERGQVNPSVLVGFHDFSSVQVACDGLGAASSVGSLSVPPSWPVAGPGTEPAPVDTVEVVAAAPPGRTFHEGLMGMMGGHRATADDGNDAGQDDA